MSASWKRRSDQVLRDIARDADQGNGIHVRIGDSGHQVGRTRPGGGDHDTGFSRDPGIALGHVDRPLLVPGQYMADLTVIEGVVDRKHRPSGISENGVHPFSDEAAEQDFRTGQLPRFCPFLLSVLRRDRRVRHLDRTSFSDIEKRKPFTPHESQILPRLGRKVRGTTQFRRSLAGVGLCGCEGIAPRRITATTGDGLLARHEAAFRRPAPRGESGPAVIPVSPIRNSL